MKRYASLIAAVLLSAAFALSQTNYLGNILQLHRQVEPLPTATNYTGAILYNYDAGTVYVSNGTTWTALGGASGSSYWIDAGSGGIYPSSDPLQVRVGVRDYLEPTMGQPGSAPVGAQMQRATLWVYADGGTPVGVVKRQERFINSVNMLNPANSEYEGANLALATAFDGGSFTSYSQILMYGTGQTGNQWGTITEANPGVGSFTAGMNIMSTGNVGLTGGAATSIGVGYPSLLVQGSDHTMSIGQVAPTSNARITVNGTSMSWGVYVTATPSMGLGFANSGPDIDLGGGGYDYFDSNGTRIQQGNLGGGGLDVNNLRIGGNTGASTTVTSTTTGNGGIGFNQASGTHYMMATNKEYRPIKSGYDWVLDGRTMQTEVSFEQTACPTLRTPLLNSAGSSISVNCTDDVAATATTGSGFPAKAYRNFIANGSAGDRAILVTGTAPAIGATWACTSGGGCFIQRGGGPIMRFWMRVNEDWSTNTLFYAGMGTALPTSGQPATSASAVYVRYDRSTDSNFNLCAVGGSARTCTAGTTAPANATEYLITIDCSESSTACYLYVNGAYEATVSSNLPATSSWMGVFAAIEFVSTSQRSFGLGRLEVTTE